MEYYMAVKKEKLLHFATIGRDLEKIMLSELSQTVKEKYHTISYMWNLVNTMN